MPKPCRVWWPAWLGKANSCSSECPGEPLSIDALQIILQKQRIQGWPSGSAADSEDTLKFSVLTGVRPMIEKYPLAQAGEAFDQMMSGKARFRVVLTCESGRRDRRARPRIAVSLVLIALQVFGRHVILRTLVHVYLAHIGVRSIFHAGYRVRFQSLAFFH